MKWIGGTSFSSHVTGKVVTVVAAFIFCSCLTIKSSAQTGSAFLCKIAREQTKTHDPAPKVIANRVRRIDGGILNLDSAPITALREAKLCETRATEPEASRTPASTSASTSGDASDDDVEKSRSKTEPDARQKTVAS